MIDSRTSPRREVAAVAILTVIGAILRLWGAGRLGLTHFDEGIYALAGTWIYAPDGLAGLDPMVIPYAPPGVPILIGLAYFLGQGVSDHAAIAVSLVAGILTIPVVGWVGRRTFGPGSGAAAAAFAAISGPHVAFSRMALTDATFLLAWLVAIGLGGRFLERPRLGRALALGLAVGVVQYVKYHGWLAGAVIALAAWPALRGPRRDLVRTIGYGSIAALLAVIGYLPWVRFVEGHGSYAALMHHQRSYLGGLTGWLPHLRLQMAQAVALSGGPWWGGAAWGLAWAGSRLAGSSRANPAAVGWPGTLSLIAGAAAMAAMPELPWWVGVIVSPMLARDSTHPARRALGVGFLVLTLMTPFYHPYARLWLPLHAAGWLILGGVLPRLASWVDSTRTSLQLRPRLGWRQVWAVLAAVALILGFRSSPKAHPLPGLLAPTDGLRTTLELGIIRDVTDRPTLPLHALIRPTILFYLTGRVSIRRYPDLPALLKGYRPGEFALIDQSLLDPRAGPLRHRQRIGRPPAAWTRLWAPEGLPTSLDEDPGRAVGSGRIPTIQLDFLDAPVPASSAPQP